MIRIKYPTNQRQGYWRRKLFNINSKCYWCNRETSLFAYDPKYSNQGKVYENAATVDHMYSRFSLERKLEEQNGLVTLVNSCKACNERRGKEDEVLAKAQGMLLVKDVSSKEYLLEKAGWSEDDILIYADIICMWYNETTKTFHWSYNIDSTIQPLSISPATQEVVK